MAGEISCKQKQGRLVATYPASPEFVQPETDGYAELRGLGKYL